MKELIYLCFIVLLFISCKEEQEKSDAYGNFEATTTTVSSESRGKLIYLNVDEGESITEGSLIGLVDTTDHHLQRALLYAQIGAIKTKTTDPNPEIAVFQKQKSNLVRERDRVLKLVTAKAATSKQLDDIEGQIVVVDQQIEAAQQRSSLANRGILSERDPIQAQINAVNQQIKNCYIYNPVNGTIINKLSEKSEIVNFGSPLYTIADLTTLTVRAYTDALKMQELTLNQSVTVLVDDMDQSLRALPGKVTWISENAEFTPKTIQTKKERVNLVYAIKIEVNNDGRLKMGMPAEVMFDPNYKYTAPIEE